jgi:hypothetical protein
MFGMDVRGTFVLDCTSGYEPLSCQVRLDKPEIVDHPVDSRLVWVGFEFLHVGAVKFGVPVVWIHLGRDHIVDSRIVRDPGGVSTDRAPDGVVVPRILLEELGHTFDTGQRKYVPGHTPKNEDRSEPFRNISIIFALY